MVELQPKPEQTERQMLFSVKEAAGLSGQSPRTRSALQRGLRLASKFSTDEDPIFASRNGQPLRHRNVTRRGFEAARDLAELPRSLTFHQLRHAAASRLIATGLDPVTVASVLGHDDPSVTLKVYAHLFNRQDKHDAVRLALAGDGQA